MRGEAVFLIVVVVIIVCFIAAYLDSTKRQRTYDDNLPARRQSDYAPSRSATVIDYYPEPDYNYVIRRINAETEILIAEERRVRAQINYEIAVHDLHEVRTLTHQRARLR